MLTDSTPTTTCPHCQQVVDARHRMTGDRVWHPACGGWYLVLHQPGGGTILKAVDPPATWPSSRQLGPS